MKNYLVTGGAGFIGSNIAKRLTLDGHRVFILDDLSTGFERNLPAEAVFTKCDISSTHATETAQLPEKLDAVYHIAAQPSGEASFDDPARDSEINFRSTLNMLQMAREKGCRRFMFASSMSVYGEVPEDKCIVREDGQVTPASYYGCHKLASEQIIRIFSRQADINATSYRLFNVYGYNQNMHNMKQGMVSIYMSYLLNDQPVHVKGALDRFRDFIFVDDVVEMFLCSETDERTFGEVFNLGTGHKTTVRDLLEVMLAAYGKEDFDKWVYTEGSTPGDIKGCIADMTKLNSITGWKAGTDLAMGMRRMKAWVDSTLDLWRERAVS